MNLPASSQNLTAAFTAKAQAVAAEVQEAPDLAQALSRAVAMAKDAAGGGPPILAAPGLGEKAWRLLEPLCREAGVELITSGLSDKGPGFTLGLTWADRGVAATGTLIIDSRDEDLRRATMLSEVHVALLPKARLADRLADIQDELSGLIGQSPGYTAFITGASRTADIERVLTIGVHGPGRLCILLLDQEPA